MQWRFLDKDVQQRGPGKLVPVAPLGMREISEIDPNKEEIMERFLLSTYLVLFITVSQTSATPTPTPEVPAFNTVNYEPPSDYYSSVDTSSSTSLRTSLHNIIDDHKRYKYTSSKTDTWDILEKADEYSCNNKYIIDVYKNTICFKSKHSWNREHTWPKSYGFPDKNARNYPYTDCHALRACDSKYNSYRSNKIYDDCDLNCDEREAFLEICACEFIDGNENAFPGYSNWTDSDSWMVWHGRRGDIARGLFYMDIRYEGGTHGETGYAEPDLILTNDTALIYQSKTGNNELIAYMGILDVLIQWHLNDPVDDCERRRNQIVWEYQENRNPFIDHPEWICIIWGNRTPCE